MLNSPSKRTSSPWRESVGRGFLPAKNPPTDFGTTHCPWDETFCAQLDTLAQDLPTYIQGRDFRARMRDLPVMTLPDNDDSYDGRFLERAFLVYGLLASAYVFAPHDAPATHLPASLAVPLVALAERLERPPILAYAPYTLYNWRKLDPQGDVRVDNLMMLHRFIPETDAAWFTLIHVDIEARAAQGLHALQASAEAVQNGDTALLLEHLGAVAYSLDAMMATFKRMTEGCDPVVYYTKVRPYFFSFENIIYEGVDDTPRHYNGETGAQSSVVPALVAGLGLSHETSDMTRFTDIMRTYMPREHRQAIVNLGKTGLRAYVEQSEDATLRDAYNHALRRLLAFRKMHLSFAKMYIADHVDDPRGSGGTMFMHWLRKLTDETDAQML
jgi:indoleamine 2,3-dioxygenase